MMTYAGEPLREDDFGVDIIVAQENCRVPGSRKAEFETANA